MLQIANIKKTYRTEGGCSEVLKGVGLDVKPGQLVAIMGPSGCGKSTLLNILGLFHSPDSGQYVVDGMDVLSLSRKEQARFRRQSVGFVLQAANLLENTTVYENLEFPLIYSGVNSRSRKSIIEDALATVGLSQKMRCPTKFLSGGEQQRVAIARAMVGRPKIVLGDEPTGQLDQKNSRRIMRYFRKVTAESSTAMIIVTHDVAVANQCSKVYYLRDGELRRVKAKNSG